MFAATTRINVQLLTLIFLLSLSWTSSQIDALTCYCNICGPQTDSCETKSEKEGYCYKHVEKSLDNGTYSIETSYGCISGGDSLAHLQCYTNNLKHRNLRLMQCCKTEDNCNELLPDPNETEDTRWKIEPPVELTTKSFNLETWHWYFFFSTILALLLLIIVLKSFLTKLYKFYSTSTNDSRGSTCSLKAELEKFHHQHAASSSISTHSYSVSDDLSHKIPVPHVMTHDDSFIPEDLTSGLGERMLNQRTMARAVGFGKTDHVGNGRFGRVFRGQYHGEDVAVKAFKTIDQDSWRREDTIFRTLNHDNIVRFIASEVTSIESTTTEIWMFLEYCPHGSLCDYLDSHDILGPQQAVRILYSIINGLNYLHEDYAQASKLYKPSIAHRDIKSKNILMKTPDSCCIADFGHALIKVDEETLDYGKYQHLQVGTIRYMAPEILRPNTSLDYRHFSTFAQADLYQYGLILWEVCHKTSLDLIYPAGAHKLPYDGVVPPNPDMQDMIKIVCEDQYRPPRFEKWDKNPLMKRLADLMVECWRPNPKARMETLGVKKRLREMYDLVIHTHPPYQQYHQPYPIINFPPNSSLSANFNRDKTKSIDATM